jgi:hypothetical protein
MADFKVSLEFEFIFSKYVQLEYLQFADQYNFNNPPALSLESLELMSTEMSLYSFYLNLVLQEEINIYRSFAMSSRESCASDFLRLSFVR